MQANTVFKFVAYGDKTTETTIPFLRYNDRLLIDGAATAVGIFLSTAIEQAADVISEYYDDDDPEAIAALILAVINKQIKP